mmetsp:Transcript_86977/g.245338  ORF Transcript_86977/g.245338 Transcript_86977/m.245338 type:complete len:284 (-) Transcript_86977:110-961(-)
MHLLNERVHVLHRLGPVSVAFTVFLGLLMSSIVHFGTSVHRVRIRFSRGPEFDQGGSRSPVFSVLQAQDPAKEHFLVGMPQPVDLCRGLDQIQKQHADNHNDKNGQETASDGAKHADGMQPIDLACVLFTFRHLLPELGKVGRDLVLVRAPVREAEEEEVEKNQRCHNQAVIHDARLIRKVQSHVPPQCPPILDVLLFAEVEPQRHLCLPVVHDCVHHGAQVVVRRDVDHVWALMCRAQETKSLFKLRASQRLVRFIEVLSRSAPLHDASGIPRGELNRDPIL